MVPGERRLSSWSKAVQCKNDGARFAVKRSGANGSRDWHGIGLAEEAILL